MGTFLDKLVAATLEELGKRKAETAPERLVEMIAGQRPARDFVGAITGPTIKLIAEIKRASPSKGDLNPSIDAVSLAQTYQSAGASAISVLTEPRFFKGSLSDLAAVASAVDIPVLRKDFVLDAYQVYEARAFGADAVLLIAAILSDEHLADLLDITHRLGMAALIEVHDGEELDRVLQALTLALSQGERGQAYRVRASRIAIGINNRNLADFTVDLGTTLGLRARVPVGMTMVSESGIHSREDVLQLEAAGVNAILVGEALVTSGDPQARIRSLLG